MPKTSRLEARGAEKKIILRIRCGKIPMDRIDPLPIQEKGKNQPNNKDDYELPVRMARSCSFRCM